MGASLEVPLPSALAGHVALSGARFPRHTAANLRQHPDDPAPAFLVPSAPMRRLNHSLLRFFASSPRPIL
jgi:hypothetical protein